MPELRHDPLQRRWVIIAPERGRRPDEYIREKATSAPMPCPFCEGNEDRTPPEICAVRHGNTPANKPGWQVRVVPNLFPALRIEGDLDRKGIGVHDRMNGIGAHEIIIETPRHDQALADMTLDHIERILWTCRERILDLYQDKRFKYILVFKNHGYAAGASLSHSHTQIIATPVTPLAIAGELRSAKDHYHHKERCLICDILEQELESGERLVLQHEKFVAMTPYASRFPFEVFLAPKYHHHSFAETGDEVIRHLARALKEVLLRIKRCLGDPAYNFLIHTIPNTLATPRRSGYWETVQADFHWHLEIMPRLTRIAGFEWGTGFYINPVSPEQAAKNLREVDL